MKIRQASESDLPTLAQLEQTHINAELTSNNDAMLGQGFNRNELKGFVDNGWIVIAQDNQNIIGYVICANWEAFQKWPIYKAILKQIKEIEPTYNQQNTCQYGPIWLHEDHRSKGIFEQLVTAVKQLSTQKYQTMITFIAEENQHSYFAHTKKTNFTVIDFLEFDERGYYLLSL